MPSKPSDGPVLNLRTGDLVEVRSEAEILATLDETGSLDGLPFMPEMLAYCGRQVRVYKRADKTCDTIEKTGGRRMTNTVHLADLRCDGQAHGGCQAACLLFWKETWLKRVPDASAARRAGEVSVEPPRAATCDRGRLSKATCVAESISMVEPLYRCQATELRRASSPLEWWDLRQYVRDVRCGNVGFGDVLRALGFRLFTQLLRVRGYRLYVGAYDAFQRWTGGTPFPFKGGSLTKTPRATLGLVEGDLVRVKSHDEILATVDTAGRNRGLLFDVEMVPYCGGTYRVRGRVERLIDEKTGRMRKLSNDCIILDGVYCRSRFSDRRLFCPRSIFSYWREIWLTRADEGSMASDGPTAPPTTRYATPDQH
jgi:hypothetical protein